MTVSVNKITPFEQLRIIHRVEGMTSTSAEAATLAQFLRCSFQSYEGIINNQIACVWGFILPSVLSENAYLWMYTTHLVKEHQFVFVRHSQRVLEKLLDEFPVIVGHCMKDARQSQRWLKWLGAEFGFPDDSAVIPFTIRKKLHG